MKESQDKLIEALLQEDARLPDNAPDQELLDQISAKLGTPTNIVEPPMWRRPFVLSSLAACAIVGLMIAGSSLYMIKEDNTSPLISYNTAGKGAESDAFKVKVAETDAIDDEFARRPSVEPSRAAQIPPPASAAPVAKVISSTSPGEVSVEVPPVISAGEPLDFGTTDSFSIDADFAVKSPKSTPNAYDYAAAKRAYEQERQELQEMKYEHTASLMKIRTPRSPVTIFEDATEAERISAGEQIASYLGDKRKQLKKIIVDESKAERNRIGQSSRYAPLVDQAFKSPTQAPLSTFSVDTDRASYTNLRNTINQGGTIHPDSIRVEELVNAFSYDYAQPAGEHPFAVHVETADCPWNGDNRLVKIGLKGQEIDRDKRPASNLVLLCDVSGSMQSPRKLGYLKKSFMELIENLDARDTVSIVTYAGAEGVALAPTKADAQNRQKIFQAVENLTAGGSTNGEAGIRLAYQLANKHFIKGGVNRVLLATDGDFNVGLHGDDDLLALVKKGSRKGTYLTVLGFGHDNLNDQMLERITNDGDGQYFFIDSAREGTRVFGYELTGTLMTIAKDVKIQVEFNPREVREYRLLGYANRQLKDEDFNNDRVDAGEIGAGHTVTAFYEIVPGPAVPAVDELKYASPLPAKPGDKNKKPRNTKQAELLTVKLRYKQPTGGKSSLIEHPVVDAGSSLESVSDDFRFATAVALYGMLLRDSEHLGPSDYSMVEHLAASGARERRDRLEFIKLVSKSRP